MSVPVDPSEGCEMQVTPLTSKATALVLMSLGYRCNKLCCVVFARKYIEVEVNIQKFIPLRTEPRRLYSRRSASSAGARNHTIY